MGEKLFKESKMTEEIFTQTVKAYMDTIYRVALNYLRDPSAAEDVCQEVFLRLFRSGQSFEFPEHCRNWLIHVAINECRRVLASPWRRIVTTDVLPDMGDDSDPAGESVFETVMELPRKYRVVLHLYYYEGYSTKEIAQLLRLPNATVRSQLDRGREILKQRLLEAEHV